MARPRSPRGVLDLTETTLIPPPVVALDSSFVVAALVVSEDVHDVCRHYLEHLAEAGTVVVISPVLRLEVAETVFRIAVRERHSGSVDRHRRDGRVRRGAGRLMRQTMESWQEALAGFDWASVAVDAVLDDATEIMHRYGLGSFDAAHAATAWKLDVHDFVTLDPDFALLPQTRATLHTIPSQLRRARTIRGGT